MSLWREWPPRENARVKNGGWEMGCGDFIVQKMSRPAGAQHDQKLIFVVSINFESLNEFLCAK